MALARQGPLALANVTTEASPQHEIPVCAKRSLRRDNDELSVQAGSWGCVQLIESQQ